MTQLIRVLVRSPAARSVLFTGIVLTCVQQASACSEFLQLRHLLSDGFHGRYLNNGKPVPGFQLTLYKKHSDAPFYLDPRRSSEAMKTVGTASNGSFDFGPLPAGVYYVVGSNPGHFSIAFRFTPSEKSEKPQAVTLELDRWGCTQFRAEPVLGAVAAAPELQKQLEAMVRTHHGKVALFAKHLRTGATVSIDATTPVQTASVIKLPIMLEAFAQVKAGKRSLDDKIVLREEDKVPGSGILQFLRPGAQFTLEDAIVLMMTLSDNASTNLVIDQVGIPAVNARSAAMGLKNTYLYKKVYRKAEGPMPDDQKKFGLGKTTAAEMAAVLESIERCDLGDSKLCTRMIEIMKNQQSRLMIVRYLETADATEVRSGVAAKLGELDEVKNEVALVYTDSGPIVISIFTWDNEDQRWMADNEAYLLIARMAKTIVDAWAPKGVVSAGTHGMERAAKPTAAARSRISHR